VGQLVTTSLPDWFAEKPYCVFAFDHGTRLHELGGQVSVRGKNDETGCIEVHGAYVDPPPLAWPGQVAPGGTFGRTACRTGFVVRDEVVLRPRVRSGCQSDRFTVEAYALATLYLLADLRNAPVHGNAARGYPAFN
jgi:hypothetical protein